MNNSYYDTYKKRVNRYGNDYHSRIQGQREREFEDYLIKSVYRTDINYKCCSMPATVEPYKQDKTSTLAYLLTRVKDVIPNGTILEISNVNHMRSKWLVWWMEEYKASGYNRYVMIRLNTGFKYNGMPYYGCLQGPGSTKIQDTVKSSTGDVLYEEDQNLYMLIMPMAKWIDKDLYIELSGNGFTKGFRICGFDCFTTPGICYISLDPTYQHYQIKEEEIITPPAPTEGEEAPKRDINNDGTDDYAWLDGLFGGIV